ncbi:hypothetical protein CAL7716_084940 [Calothrix sp. PCC 7716]|nr:hypothetical protein CAL7716_084940 [Calothrix sp. PCC 7716]
MLVVDPIPLYKDGEWRRIPAIDSQAWINAGWSLTETPVVEQNTENAPENPLSNSELTPTEVKVSDSNLQPESTETKVEQANTQLTPTETTKAEDLKTKTSKK